MFKLYGHDPIGDVTGGGLSRQLMPEKGCDDTERAGGRLSSMHGGFQPVQIQRPAL